VIVRPLDREDLDQMDSWSPSNDPLLALWGVPQSDPISRSIWFSMYISDPSRLWYSIDRRSDGVLMGTISLRDIIHAASARLGISFGPEYVDLGYGTESLRVFLPHYFGQMGFAALVLDVAAANRRAVHVYEKLGFAHAGSHYRDAAEGVNLSFLELERYRPLRGTFRCRFGHTQILFYDMTLDRAAWDKAERALTKQTAAPRS